MTKEVQKLQLHQLQNHFTVRFMKRLGGNLGWEEEASAHPLCLDLHYTWQPSTPAWAPGPWARCSRNSKDGHLVPVSWVGSRERGGEIPRASGTHCRPLTLSQQEGAACSGLCIPASKVLSPHLWYDGFRLYRAWYNGYATNRQVLNLTFL